LSDASSTTKPDSPSPVTQSNASPQPLVRFKHRSDLGNARLFATLHKRDIRYCHKLGKWFIWNAKRWVEDETGEILRMAKLTALRLFGIAAHGADDEERRAIARHAIKTQSERGLNAMVNLARSESGIAVKTDELDSDEWLLNVSNGTLNLRTGKLKAHEQKDLITKLIPINYDPNAKCSTWEKFLDQITGGDTELIKFLQKAIGYSLTGSTKEQIIFILHGTGANGKTTFISTISDLLGDYARHTPTETFLRKNGNPIPADVARLRGARFVSADEAEGGTKLAESQVKQLTGSDRITARHLYGHFFEFEPTFKIFLTVNHKPIIRESTHAMWRRIRLVPFNVTISDNQQDKNLREKLKKELPGILRWAVEGVALWQKEGLLVPDSVRIATESYQAESDLLGDFIVDCCEVVPGAKTPFKDLYNRYVSWAQDPLDALTIKAFGDALTERGFTNGRTASVRVRIGIQLRGGSPKARP
jgi:putative DNA primase/helicase